MRIFRNKPTEADAIFTVQMVNWRSFCQFIITENDAMKDLELSYAEDWQNSTGNPLKSLTKVRHILNIMKIS